MRRILCAVLLAVACRPAPLMDVNATPPFQPDARLVPMLTGTWEGRSYRSENDSGVPWTLIQNESMGVIVGRLSFTGSLIVPAEVKLIDATDSTVTSLIGPYYSPTIGAEVVTRVEGRHDGDRLWGTFYARPVTGGKTVRGRFEARRVKSDEPV